MLLLLQLLLQQLLVQQRLLVQQQPVGIAGRRRDPEPASGSRAGAGIPSRRRDPGPVPGSRAGAGILNRAWPGPGRDRGGRGGALLGENESQGWESVLFSTK